MQLDRENINNPFAIKRCAAGLIEVNDEVFRNDILVFPNKVEIWENANLEHLNINIFLSHAPDIVLLGTGEKMHFLSTETLIPLHTQGIGIEIMTTAAACRTFNVLLAENRNVLAALIIT